MTVFLETPRLVLRRFTEDDADNLFALDGDPEVMRYIGPFRLDGPDAYREQIRTRILPYYARYAGYGSWAAAAKGGGAFLGWFHLRPGLDSRFAAEAGYRAGDVELGYRFLRAAWGRGYATEGACALVRRAFAEPETTRVVASALSGNVASLRVMEKAGLQRVGTFRLPGYEQCGVKYALERISGSDARPDP